MPEKLKHQFFTTQSLLEFANFIAANFTEFDVNGFIHSVQDENWEALELKEKMRQTTVRLHEILNLPYREALKVLVQAAPSIHGFEGMCLPDYVEVYGRDDVEASLAALRVFTRYSSSEFAIRPFLDREPERTIAFMKACAVDEHENVRRFASEGCRPRLPWAMALPKFKKDPTLVLEVLELLRDDPSEFVRRSVANNLNDISKDNPEVMLETCERWFGTSERSDWIVKHACRSLLKAGDKRALMLFGFEDPANLAIENLTVSNSCPSIGDDIDFGFDLVVNESEPCKVRIEYAVHYMKANGKQSPKVFQISEKTFEPGRHSYRRKQAFRDLSTRKHYPGRHKIVVIVNGEEKASVELELGG